MLMVPFGARGQGVVCVAGGAGGAEGGAHRDAGVGEDRNVQTPAW